MIETLASLALGAGRDILAYSERSAGETSGVANPKRWLIDVMGASPTHSGERVGPDTALNYVAVYTAVRILSDVEASLPLHVFRRKYEGGNDVGRERATNHYSYRLLHDAPNEEMTSFTFRQYMRQNRALWGNAYARIDWDNRGRAKALWPLRPDRMRVYRNVNGRLIYEYTPSDGPVAKYLPEDIIHIRGLGDDLVGYSPIKLARQSIGLGLAAEKFGARFFGSGARPSGILQLSGSIDPKKRPEIEAEFDEKYASASNSHKTLITDQGSKFVTTTIPPNDAQFLETRLFQSSEITSKIYGVPPTLTGDTEKSTSWGTGIEQQMIGFLQLTIGPSLECAEQEYERKLLISNDLYVEHDIDGLLRADFQTRMQGLTLAVQNGLMTRNEGRKKLNLEPLPGGDVLTVQSQNVPLGSNLVQE